MLDQFRAVERAAADGGLTFAEAMRLLAGANVSGDPAVDEAPDWSRVVAGSWLATTLDHLRRAFRPSARTISPPAHSSSGTSISRGEG